MARPADPNAKQALVAAARGEFARRSLRGARIEDITLACGLSKGAFYLHFPSKESLFGELVQAFLGQLEGLAVRRRASVLGFFAAHPGLTARSLPASAELLELESQCDLSALEVMWQHRDVLGVLINGCQGTRFEGAVWQMVEQEMARVRENFDEFKAHGVCRDDIPFEVFGSLIIGTYLLLGMRMSRAVAKPDLLEWARSLHVLLREGNAPLLRTAPASGAAARAPAKRAAAASAKSATRARKPAPSAAPRPAPGAAQRPAPRAAPRPLPRAAPGRARPAPPRRR